MKIGILGTGSVGQTLGSALISKEHHVMLGSRTATNEKAKAWTDKNGQYALQGTFQDAASFGEILLISLNGSAAIDVLKQLTPASVKNKVIIDLTNPLDFSQGMPPSILPKYSNRFSLGEDIQNTLPESHIVKGLNTVTANLMVNAHLVNNGNHNLFICGNNVDAKIAVKHFLADNFNWKPEYVLDMGDIKAARLTEAIVPFWVGVMQVERSAMFNYLIVK